MLELELRSVPAQAAAPSNTSSTAQANIIIEVNQAIDSHDWRTLTQMTVDLLVNYSGHRHVTNAYIAQDMQNNSRTYEWVHSTTYPNTFTHEVSDQYSSYWNGPMLYDSINVYSEAQERNGKLHRAMTRLIVGCNGAVDYLEEPVAERGQGEVLLCCSIHHSDPAQTASGGEEEVVLDL